jgi:hypothetical protein
MVVFAVGEGQGRRYSAFVRDGRDLAVLPADLTQFTLTLTRADCCPDPPLFVNGRDHQDVLGGAAPGVTIDPVTGEVVWILDPADLTIGDPWRRFATHRAQFDFAVVGAPNPGIHVVLFEIEAAG